MTAVNTRPDRRLDVEGIARAAGIVACPIDGEVRPEALDVDAVRWLGVWHLVMGVQRAATGTHVRLLDPEAGVWRTVFYRFGVWIAAARRVTEPEAA